MPALPEKPHPRSPWRRRALLAAIGLVLLDQLLLWTFVTRPATSLRALVELTNAPEPPYYGLRPALDTTYASWRRGDVTHIRTNALGFRDGERSPAKARGEKRVIVAGDSIAFGIGVNDEEAFPQQMQRIVSAGGRAEVQVWNAGVPGYAMADHLGLLRKRLLDLGPDVLVLQLSRNDTAVPMPLSRAFLEALRFSGLARLWMLVRFNLVTDTALFRASFLAYVEECKRAAIPLVLFHEGLPEDCAAEVLEVAAKNGIPVIDSGKDTLPKLPDDPHYDPVGNRMVAERLVPAVLARLHE